MSDAPKSLIETLVEAIKGYFSITGLILVGIYMLRNPDTSPFGLSFLNYLGDFSATIAGSGIGVWYSVHLWRKLYSHTNRENFRKGERILYGIFIVLASVIVISILAGAVTMSCGQLL